jgi:exopolysaccharide biosynthesis WecB/TagA/CpsF family protein
MIDYGKKNILGIKIDAIDYDAAVEKVIEAAKTSRSYTVTALAVHGVMTGVLDNVHALRLNSLDLIVPDGQPVRWAINWLYKLNLPDRVYGPELMLRICRAAESNNLPIFLYGNRDIVLEKLSKRIIHLFPEIKIAGVLPSKFRRVSLSEKQEIIEQIKHSGARILFVGLGCPKQEVWVYEAKNYLDLSMIAVGAAFNFHAGILPQAPIWAQNHGLEWLYRLSKEPKRLWKRYLLLNPLYLSLLIFQKIGLLYRRPINGDLPEQNLCLYG